MEHLNGTFSLLYLLYFRHLTISTYYVSDNVVNKMIMYLKISKYMFAIILDCNLRDTIVSSCGHNTTDEHIEAGAVSDIY